MRAPNLERRVDQPTGPRIAHVVARVEPEGGLSDPQPPIIERRIRPPGHPLLEEREWIARIARLPSLVAHAELERQRPPVTHAHPRVSALRVVVVAVVLAQEEARERHLDVAQLPRLGGAHNIVALDPEVHVAPAPNREL